MLESIEKVVCLLPEAIKEGGFSTMISHLYNDFTEKYKTLLLFKRIYLFY
jgi:hypothetical protein